MSEERDLLIAQLCADLNQAHDELLKVQGVAEDKRPLLDWPEWSPQANSIRWAERLLGIPLSKTSNKREARKAMDGDLFA